MKQRIDQPSSGVSSRFVLLDRDGVINVDRPDSVRCIPDCLEIPNAGEAIAILNRLGFRILVISNQAIIGRGLVSRSQVREINQHLSDVVAMSGGVIEAFYVCPHAPDSDCDCRKPRPGLITQAQQDYGFEPARTAFVGDARRDVDAAIAAGCRPVLVESGKPRDLPGNGDVETYPDLFRFATSIRQQESLGRAV